MIDLAKLAKPQHHFACAGHCPDFRRLVTTAGLENHVAEERSAFYLDQTALDYFVALPEYTPGHVDRRMHMWFAPYQIEGPITPVFSPGDPVRITRGYYRDLTAKIGYPDWANYQEHEVAVQFPDLSFPVRLTIYDMEHLGAETDR